MFRSRGGYTIIEVTTVLAITAILFGSAVALFQGQQGKTVLSQSLYNLASQIQNYSSQVNAGVYNGSSNYQCQLNGTNQAYLTTSGSGSTGQCLFMGRALQIVKGGNTMESYTVLGSRVANDGSIVSSFDQANPVPATDQSGSNWYLTNKYVLSGSETFSNSIVKDISGNTKSNYYMVGIFNDLSGGGSSTSLSVRGYNFQDTNLEGQGAAKACIEQNSPCNSYVNVRTWEICVQDGSRAGSIIVTPTPTGVTTSVNAGACV